MAVFEMEGPDGKTYEIEAPNMQAAAQAAQQVAAKKLPDIGTAQSALVGGVQGASFGFADEIMGGASAVAAKAMGNPADLSTLYDAAVSVPRMAQKSAAEHHPVAYYGGQIAGGVAPAIVSGGAGIAPQVARAGLGVRTAVASAEGAAYGALHGAGSADGDLIDRAIGAGYGAAGGAATGALLPGAVDATKAAWRGVSAPVQGMLRPDRFGNEKFAEALLRDKNPAGWSGAKSGRTAQGVVDDLWRLRFETGKDMRLMDMGGENSRNLLRSAANMASTGTQRLNRTLDGPTRQGGQWRRIEKDMARGLGSPDDYAASIDQIVAERDLLAKPLFDQAFKLPIRPTEQLISVLHRPGMQSILQRTAAKMADEGADVSGAPPMVLLHRAKMEIDHAINQVKSGDANTANWDVRTLTKLKHDLLDAIDSPTYREALKVSAGDNALRSAAKNGFDEALTLPTEDLARKMRSFKNDSERDMYRMGASRALATKIRRSNITHDRTENVFSSPDMQMRLRALFPSNRARREFQRDLILEARMADTRKAVQGGPTTAKQLAQGQEAAAPVAAVGSLANAATGRLEPLFSTLGRTANRFSGLTPAASNAIINAGLTRGGGNVSNGIVKALMRAEEEPLRRAANARSLNAISGALLGGLGQRNNER